MFVEHKKIYTSNQEAKSQRTTIFSLTQQKKINTLLKTIVYDQIQDF